MECLARAAWGLGWRPVCLGKVGRPFGSPSLFYVGDDTDCHFGLDRVSMVVTMRRRSIVPEADRPQGGSVIMYGRDNRQVGPAWEPLQRRRGQRAGEASLRA